MYCVIFLLACECRKLDGKKQSLTIIMPVVKMIVIVLVKIAGNKDNSSIGRKND